MPHYDATDLFAGAGGWEALGTDPVIGIEIDPHAVTTRRMMRLPTIEADVRKYSPMDLPYTAGLIASPPCQTFSRAGLGSGRDSIDGLVAAVHSMARFGALEQHLFEDERTELVLEPLRWALQALDAGRPYRWITLEQVPAVLPIWEAIAEVLRANGYSAVTAKMQAEQYGVAQTRERAILIASLDHVVAIPTPTHSRFYSRTPAKLDTGVAQWISMAEALGWGMTQRPYPTVAAGTASGGADPQMIGGSGARKRIRDEKESGRWIPWTDTSLVGFPRAYDGGSGGAIVLDGKPKRRRDLRRGNQPAFTVTEKARSWMRWLDYDAVAAEAEHGVMPDGAPRLNNQSGTAFDYRWPALRPAAVIAGRDLVTMPGANANRFNGSTKSRNDGLRVTQAEAAVLQSFPLHWDWQGTKTQQFQQIGNAIPPLLAEHIKAAAR